MADPYLSQITMFAGSFAPRDYSTCDGQLIAISQNQALFALLGTMYGGDGRTNFKLPDMRSRLPAHFGQGPGLTNRAIGHQMGQERVNLSVNQIPSHNHSFNASANVADSLEPLQNTVAVTQDDFYSDQNPSERISDLEASVIGNTGGDQSHSNIMPYTCLTFIISLAGTFPTRN